MSLRDALASARREFEALELRRAALESVVEAKSAWIVRAAGKSFAVAHQSQHRGTAPEEGDEEEEEDDDMDVEQLSSAEIQAASALASGDLDQALSLYSAIDTPHAKCAYASLAVRHFMPDLEEDEDFAASVRQAFVELQESGSRLNRACDAERAVFLGQIDEDLQGAMDAYDSAIEWNPADANILYNYANFMSFQLGLEDQASDMYRRCLEVDPDHVNALNNLASILVENSRAAGSEKISLLKQARGLLARAQTLAPGLPAYNMACIDALLGDYSSCEANLIEAMAVMDNISANDLLGDEDLASVSKAPWFTRLVKARPAVVVGDE